MTEANFSGKPEDAADDAGAPLEQDGTEPLRRDQAHAPDGESQAPNVDGMPEADPPFGGEPAPDGSTPEAFEPEARAGGLPAFAAEAARGVSLPGGGSEDAPGEARERVRYLGVRLRRAGQVFFFPDQSLSVRVGSEVIVEFEQGTAFGEVAGIIFVDPVKAAEEEGTVPGRIIGLATVQDIALHAENRILGAEATAFCTTCIRQRSLDMKLVDVEVLHDRSKIIFYFTAPSRIDFRELVKDLVRNYRTRIELRQIGVRHETQMIGGLGNCGMVCCCHKYLRKFAPVTIKMAKEQNLFLNPAKLSGMCGRLLCCLSFEQGNYEEFNKRCPKLGKKYATEDGVFRVIRANMFNQSIVVCSEGGEESELTLEEWESKVPRRAEPQPHDAPRAAQPQRPPGEGGRKGRARGREDRNPGERTRAGNNGLDFSPPSNPAAGGGASPPAGAHGGNSGQSPRFEGSGLAGEYPRDERRTEDKQSAAADGSDAPGIPPQEKSPLS